MSNVNAVAIATEGLKVLLRNALQDAGAATVTGAEVSSVRPHTIPGEFHGVNVFLYQVVPNVALRNDDLPTRRASGELIRRPQLALDLHYLLTFAGDETALEPQRVLGAALTGLYAHAELTPEDIEGLAATAPAGSYLHVHNDLAHQVERVRFMLMALNVEELSKLWAMFPQTPYNLCAAVQGSVVLLEAPLTPAPRRPVLQRGIYTGLPRPPELSTISPQLTPRTRGVARAELTLEGVALAGRATRVRIDELAPVPALVAGERRVVVRIPDELRAGIHRLTVLVAHVFDDAGVTREFELESNALPFVLEPRITTASPLAASTEGVVTIDVDPPIAPRQRVRLVVGSQAIPWTTPLPGPAVPAEHGSFTVTLPPSVVAGRHPLRIEVDGATSTLSEAVPGDVPSPLIEVT